MLNAFITAYCLAQQSISFDDFRMCLMGDDCLVLTSKSVDTKLYQQHMLELGFKVKCMLHTELTNATYCSNWMCPVKGGGFAPGPLLKTAYRIPWSISAIGTKYWRQYAHQVALSLQSAHLTPVLRVLVERMQLATDKQLTGKALRTFIHDFNPSWHYFQNSIFEMDEELAFPAFAQHYGVTEQLLRICEEQIRGMPNQAGILYSSELRRLAQAVIDVDLK